MTIREEVLNYLISTNLVENYIKKIGLSCDLEIYDDVVQECWLQICEITEQKWIDLISQSSEKDKYTKCRAYCSGLIYKNIRSDSSKLFNKLKKYKQYEYTKDDIVWDKFRNEIPDIIKDFDIEI
jgi:hypothetical protein